MTFGRKLADINPGWVEGKGGGGGGERRGVKWPIESGEGRTERAASGTGGIPNGRGKIIGSNET